MDTLGDDKLMNYKFFFVIILFLKFHWHCNKRKITKRRCNEQK